MGLGPSRVKRGRRGRWSGRTYISGSERAGVVAGYSEGASRGDRARLCRLTEGMSERAWLGCWGIPGLVVGKQGGWDGEEREAEPRPLLSISSSSYLDLGDPGMHRHFHYLEPGRICLKEEFRGSKGSWFPLLSTPTPHPKHQPWAG